MPVSFMRRVHGSPSTTIRLRPAGAIDPSKTGPCQGPRQQHRPSSRIPAMMTVEEAVAGRRSIVPSCQARARELIERVLAIAGRRRRGATCSRGACGCCKARCATRSCASAWRATTQRGEPARVQLLSREMARALSGAPARRAAGASTARSASAARTRPRCTPSTRATSPSSMRR